MSTNQEARQAALRTVTSDSETLPGDWHKLWDDLSIPSGTFNERMIAWINDQLSASYSSVNEAMAAYADNQGFDNWSSVGSGVDFSDGGSSTAGQPIGLLLILTKAS